MVLCMIVEGAGLDNVFASGVSSGDCMSIPGV
jgi:hypothetical protein